MEHHKTIDSAKRDMLVARAFGNLSAGYGGLRGADRAPLPAPDGWANGVTVRVVVPMLGLSGDLLMRQPAK